MVKCDHCGTWQEIRLDSIKSKLRRHPRLERPRNPNGTLKRIYPEPRRKEFFFACRRCFQELDRTSGQWVAKFEKEPVHGYYTSQLIAPWVTANEIIDKMANAKFKHTFWNLTLGLARSQGSGILTKEIILRCVRDYEMLRRGENFLQIY